MSKLVSILIGILIFCVIVVVHELGHLIVAKKNGILVPEFQVGFGPKLCSFKRGETEYSIRLIPFGGACKMLGEDGESDDERAYTNKGPWARFATIFAGPFFNFILAFVLAVIVISIVGYDPCVVTSVSKDSPVEAADGTPSPISQVANVSVPEARIIQIQPWESKMIKEIEKAINMSDIGINPTDDGKIIRLVFPELTEERRKDLAKDVKKKAEDAKVALRNIRRDANDAVKKLGKASEISEDVQKQLESEIDKMTEKFVAEADKKMEEKTKEIMTV